MKANELMIGDFLRYKQDFPHTHLQGKIVKVCGIRGRVDIRTIDDGNFHESEHPDWLEPILLTPEILEKNGFESNTNMFGLCDYELSKNYILENRGDRFCFVKRIRNHGSTFYIVDVNYVHELQHALRLCGIEKEIKL